MAGCEENPITAMLYYLAQVPRWSKSQDWPESADIHLRRGTEYARPNITYSKGNLAFQIKADSSFTTSELSASERLSLVNEKRTEP